MMTRKNNLLELLHSSRLMKILEFVDKFLSMLTWTTVAWFLKEIISLILCDRVMLDHVISNARWNWTLLIATWEIFKVTKVFWSCNAKTSEVYSWWKVQCCDLLIFCNLFYNLFCNLFCNLQLRSNLSKL